MDAISALQNQLGVNTSQMAFVGDSLNNVTVRPVVGLLFSPADACWPVHRGAKAVMELSGNCWNTFFKCEAALNDCIEKYGRKEMITPLKD